MKRFLIRSALVAAFAPRRRKAACRGYFERLEPRSLLSQGLLRSGVVPEHAVAPLSASAGAEFRLLPAQVEHGSVRGAMPARSAPLRTAGRARIQVVSNIVYRSVEGRSEALDLYMPTETAPAGGWPAIVAIHGGGWIKFSKDNFGRVVAPLALHGYVVVAVNYQLARWGAPSWPENFEDIRASVRWVRQHAADLGVDPNQIVALGESAGGHLATLLGTYPDGPLDDGHSKSPGPNSFDSDVSARVQAVVDFYGPTDLAALVTESPLQSASRVEEFLGGTPDQLPLRYEAASPISHVSRGDPPMLLIHGSADRVVSVTQSEELAAALSAAGVSNRLVIVPGASHDAELGPGLQFGGRSFMRTVLAFLSANLKSRNAKSF